MSEKSCKQPRFELIRKFMNSFRTYRSDSLVQADNLELVIMPSSGRQTSGPVFLPERVACSRQNSGSYLHLF